MVFLSERSVSIPNKDILSWIFDDPKFDQDEPVSYGFYRLYCRNRRVLLKIKQYVDWIYRNILTPKTPRSLFHSGRLVS